MLNFTSVEIRWSPPEPQNRNGLLLGYQIHIKGNGSTVHSNLTLNATTTKIVLNNLTLNEEYTIRACSFTKVGLGPFSMPKGFAMDPKLVKLNIRFMNCTSRRGRRCGGRRYRTTDDGCATAARHGGVMCDGLKGGEMIVALLGFEENGKERRAEKVTPTARESRTVWRPVFE